MAARKLQQEVDKCFKKVSEGVAEFESIYEKIEQSTNAAQKEKLEDNLKREIKKLQRLRDQIKTWAASNDIKDKGPLLDHRKLIETQMEKFKAVEKAMKTKAYSKEGLSAAAKLDPKERAKLEACEFLSGTVEELERQIETLEAEGESIQATMKKGKNQSSKADRMAEIERITERHKWHQGKLELIKRSLENGAVETDQVTDLEESIKYYVSDGMNEDFMEDDEMYDELNLQEEEDVYGMNNDNDRVSSQDTQSIQDEPESHTKTDHIPSSKQKPSAPEPPLAAARRPSTQLRSPLPALATLHSPLSNLTNGSATGAMKPATVPTRPPGETLKYASAAAAAANTVGIAPLPPPPGATPPSTSNTPLASLPASHVAKESPIAAPSQPASAAHTPAQRPSIPVTTLAHEARSVSRQSKSPAPSSQAAGSIPPTPATSKVESAKSGRASRAADKGAAADVSEAGLPKGPTNVLGASLLEQDESIFHLPSDLQDLIQSFKVTQKRATITPSPSSLRMLAASNASFPDGLDAEQPRYYKPKYRFNTPSYYPQEPLPIFDDPRLYSRIDPDTLFYVFYYKQGTYQQYLAAKSLKDQSWRFHKQYQTWFQRHEEPKTITEEFEQGTYRFFDYESTWMNRRKADFKFAYKFLEDDV
ncbi:proteinral negative regulator of transcription subunit 5 [Pseudogymnoascus verrucosus]|uniref:General negative regulator of transcription subunit n=1 Tax=Pseudogymnoascus verrucosus TaxID=342668 RepID=A0A1B8G984_9PEZI|nr:general negative regulator of transcription subunit 5 [Pseudogymnoascus verrucosus]OBT92396.1 proteinral negative regulator of transcription subunit 5 [Pseudogymnoascus verrucosus]